MSPKIFGRRLLVPALVAAFAAAVPAWAYSGQQYEKDAKIKFGQARADALKLYPGKITKEELEKEHGGTGLRYSFVINGANGVREVGIDANTGKVLENAQEGANPD